MSPETEMAVIVFGAVLVTIMHNKGLGMFANMMPGVASAPTATPPLARPVVPPPAPTQPSVPAPQNIPSVPVMRRPKSGEETKTDVPKIDAKMENAHAKETKEPATKTVSLHHKPAKKRNDEPVLNL